MLLLTVALSRVRVATVILRDEPRWSSGRGEMGKVDGATAELRPSPV
jgi:hypothetical protein